MTIVGLGMEGVFVPKIGSTFMGKVGIPKFKCTANDEMMYQTDIDFLI